MLALCISDKMVKNLFLLRHAQTQEIMQKGADFQRELTESGHEQASGVLNTFQNMGIAIEKIISSPAMRTRQTLNHLNFDPLRIEFSDSLYLASAGEIAAQIQSTAATTQNLLIVGHNPGIQQLTQMFNGEAHINFSPATLAHISLESENWRDLFQKEPIKITLYNH